ncbi:unnamed protein product [marine sediment metagenome]|uniref:Uncharacterized protein n=1 Tax=marine sediment metagenome TaxID=412755 RepID=X0VEU9_9ZZZZ
MKVTLGKKGLKKSWQTEFPAKTKCVHCKGDSRIGFVAHEGIDEEVIFPRDFIQFVSDLHENKGKGNLWLHDCCAVAIYFCKDCLEATALYNQG